jgi:hypothetical protein
VRKRGGRKRVLGTRVPMTIRQGRRRASSFVFVRIVVGRTGTTAPASAMPIAYKKPSRETKKPRSRRDFFYTPALTHCRSVDISPGRRVRVTVVSHFTHAKVLVSPASRGRMHGTTRWSLIGILQLGQFGAACVGEVIMGGPFAYRQGRLPYTCRMRRLTGVRWAM